MGENRLGRFLSVANKSKLVHRVFDEEDYLKLFTEILLGVSNDYLNLYIMEEDDGFYLIDCNNVYIVMDDFYDLNEDRLNKAAEEVGLTHDSYRFYDKITPKTLEESLNKFAALVKILSKYR